MLMKLNLIFSLKTLAFFQKNCASIYFYQSPKLKCFVDAYFCEFSNNSQNSRKFIPAKISDNKVNELKE